MSVEDILFKLKVAVNEEKYDMIPTKKNRESRRKYGLTIFDIEDLLCSLTYKDLHEGPISDRDYVGEELYIFKKSIKRNIVFYIKIKEKDGIIKILSCHEDEF